MEKKNLKNALKVIFRGTILGVFFFYFFSSPGGGLGGGLTNVKLFFFFFLKASLSTYSLITIGKGPPDDLNVVRSLGHVPPRLEAVLDGEVLDVRPPLVDVGGLD